MFIELPHTALYTYLFGIDVNESVSEIIKNTQSSLL